MTTKNELSNYIKNNDFKKINEILKNSSVEISNQDFRYACKKNYFQIVESILNYAEFSLPYSNESLPLSIIRGNIEVIELLLNNKKNSRYSYDYAFYYACSHGKFKVIEKLLQNKNIDPSYRNNEAILSAYKNEYYNIVSLLWADIRVKNTLDTSNVELFNKLKQMEIKTKVKQF